MGSLVVVTNLTTGQTAVMRITDRGPFVEGRMLDLTIASAKAIGIYRAGMARVRMDVFETPKPIDTGGRWCVQIGAFHDEEAAIKLKEQSSAPLSGIERDRVSRREELLGAHPATGRRPRYGGIYCAACAAG